MKNTKKHLKARVALAIALLTGSIISTAEDAQTIIDQLKEQETIVSTIAKQPIYMDTFHSNAQRFNELKKLIVYDMKSIKEDIEKIRQSMILIIQIQQEILLASK